MSEPTSTPARRRPKHDPEVSRREILRAADDLLRERDFREITVEAIMRRTGLKRPAFYVHFRDRNDVVLHVARAIGDELLESTRPWLEGESPLVDVRAALAGLTDTYARHGPVLRALAGAAAADAEVDQAYREVVDAFISATARHIRDEQARGHIDPLPDVDEIARALIWMEERYLVEALGRTPPVPPRLATDVLHRIWTATLYGTAPTRDTP